MNRYEAIVERTDGGEIYRMRDTATGEVYSVAEYARIQRGIECACYRRYAPCSHERAAQRFEQATRR